MTKEERESIIEQLCLVTGYSRRVYEKLTDKQLEMELKTLYE
ncbi:hypothetical protein [Oceanobacillus arenosus]|nr:hypothetical protein [Oceanobacillus arenosus]